MTVVPNAADAAPRSAFRRFPPGSRGRWRGGPGPRCQTPRRPEPGPDLDQSHPSSPAVPDPPHLTGDLEPTQVLLRLGRAGAPGAHSDTRTISSTSELSITERVPVRLVQESLEIPSAGIGISSTASKLREREPWSIRPPQSSTTTMQAGLTRTAPTRTAAQTLCWRMGKRSRSTEYRRHHASLTARGHLELRREYLGNGTLYDSVTSHCSLHAQELSEPQIEAVRPWSLGSLR